jgi:hypothetical protein
VCLAEVVLQTQTPAKADVKLALRKLADAMSKSEAHDVLIKRAEAVLEQDVLRSLGLVKGVAKEAPGYAYSWLEG